jgi:hypothetical protein
MVEGVSMDTSPEYIKMCEKAEEIQSIHDITDYEHDIVYCRACEEVCHEDQGYYFCCGETDGLWLPQQDDLQEMVKDINPIPSGLLWEFARWQDNATFSRYGLKSWEDLTFEKLWLGFVMDKKYGKIWNGKEWIKG